MRSGETYIHMFLCKKTQVLIAFYFSGSTLCSLYILTPNRPVILGGNDTILLAPYHTFYSNVEEHMNKVGVGSSRNLWDQPLCVGKFVKCSHRLIILINNMAMQSFVNDLQQIHTFQPVKVEKGS